MRRRDDSGSRLLTRLPEGARRLIGQVDSGQVLGASRQLKVIGDALISLAERPTGPPGEFRNLVRDLVEYLVVTRGTSSYAITNGLHLMADAALTASGDDLAIASLVKDAVHHFRTTLAQWLVQLEAHGATLLPTTGKVLIYDYSSSVSALVHNAAAEGAQLTAVIPEARSLAGGQHYLDDFLSIPIHLRLIPDAAICWALRQVDLVLVGAETLSMEGGCFNTIGTELLARLATQAGIPFHVVSLLLKVDRSIGSDGERTIAMLDFAKTVNLGRLPAEADLDCSFPDLDYTPPELITGVVTELGILTPAQLRAAVSAIHVLMGSQS